ncbi:MAG: TonB-dependent receptor, partial [Bacteroidetes bacterium]|nr:TonB-dependent receptor [Bacteroidota bacterium]
MPKKFLYILLLLFLSCSFAFSQSDSNRVVLKGIVVNQKDKKLQGVSVSVLNKTTSDVYRDKTNQSGEYSMELPKGKYKLTAVLDGYVQFDEDNLSFVKNESFNITLTEKVFSLEEIEVIGNQKQSQNDLRTSWFNLPPLSIKVLPGGLEDVMRSLKSLPGVTSPNDFTSQLVVRGSGPDQNLIVMDEVEIFNPYRLYGLVSMFNPETLSDINLITGGFPAKYGDRLSAVLDVTNREGSADKKLGMISNINIASANIIFDGKNPFNIPGSWIASTRRTYYDLILAPFARKSGLITDDSSFPSFEDLQVKLAFGPFGKHKFVVNGIFSRDGVDIVPGSERTNPDSVNVSDVTTNNVVSVGWHYIPDNNFISKTTFSWYRNSGDNNFDGDIIDPLIDKENLTPGQRDSLKAIGALLGFNFKSQYAFRKFSLGNRSVLVNGNNKYEFGGSVDVIRNDLTYKLDLDE